MSTTSLRGRRLPPALIVVLLLFPALAISLGTSVAGAPRAHAANGCLAGEVRAVASTSSGAGYWMVGTDGGVFTYGDAPFYGSMGGKPLNQPVVDIVPTRDGHGYWLIAADGGVFAFGNAVPPANNTLPNQRLNSPVVAGARIGTDGLVLTAGDGGVFTLGTAPFYGSMGGRALNQPVVDIAVSASDRGYWLVAADGGVFAFGDASAPASNPLPSQHLNAPVVGATRAGNGTGLWLTAADGGVFTLGSAPFYGSAGSTRLAKPVSGIASTPDGRGYWLVARDGGIFTYGPSAGYFGNAVSPASCATPVVPTPNSGSTIVSVANKIVNGQAVKGWGGGSVPYVWGGGHKTAVGPSTGTCSGYTGSIKPCPATTTTGVDCSGLTRWVYSIAYGQDVLGMGNTDAQLRKLQRVTTGAQPGDLVFFGPSGTTGTTHVGIFIGNGKMIEAPYTGASVRVGSLHSNLVGYYRLR